jgi:hypothetical protein
LAEHKKKSQVYIQVMEKFAIELFGRTVAEQLSWPPSLLAEDIFQYFPAGRAGTRRQRAISNRDRQPAIASYLHFTRLIPLAAQRP